MHQRGRFCEKRGNLNRTDAKVEMSGEGDGGSDYTGQLYERGIDKGVIAEVNA